MPKVVIQSVKQEWKEIRGRAQNVEEERSAFLLVTAAHPELVEAVIRVIQVLVVLLVFPHSVEEAANGLALIDLSRPSCRFPVASQITRMTSTLQCAELAIATMT